MHSNFQVFSTLGNRKLTRRLLQSVLVSLTLVTGTAAYAQCQNSGNFSDWLSDFKSEAIASGISSQVVNDGLNGVQFDPSIIRRDRAQGVFALSFLDFSDRIISQYRLDYGRNALANNAALFDRVEAQYGIPGPVLTAFWGLETDFGQVTGDSATIPALATLAYDCRRPELFRPQLMNALRLVELGDLSIEEMRGAWAGEIGQMQFLPKEYNEWAVDYDGDGRRNLIQSTPDAMASAASLMRSFGWQAGEPWLQEVRVPSQMDWSQARLDNFLSVSDWANRGVTDIDGSALNPFAPEARLLLPMGKDGPAFLAYPNFDVFLEWNQSLVYATTVAYFATRLAGEPRVQTGNAPVASLDAAQTKQLQSKLQARGLSVGKVDGIIGNQTRDAVRAVQAELGLPIDGYPTLELLNRL